MPLHSPQEAHNAHTGGSVNILQKCMEHGLQVGLKWKGTKSSVPHGRFWIHLLLMAEIRRENHRLDGFWNPSYSNGISTTNLNWWYSRITINVVSLPPTTSKNSRSFFSTFSNPPPTWLGVRFELRGQGIFQVGPLHRHLEKNWRFRWVFFDEIMFEGFVESVTTSNLYVFFVQIFVPSFLMICGGKEYLRIFCLQVSTNLGFCCHIEKLWKTASLCTWPWQAQAKLPWRFKNGRDYPKYVVWNFPNS